MNYSQPWWWSQSILPTTCYSSQNYCFNMYFPVVMQNNRFLHCAFVHTWFYQTLIVSSLPLADLLLASVFPFCFLSHVCYLIHVFLVNNCQRHLCYHSQITFLTFICFFNFKHNSLQILWKFHIMYPNLAHLPTPPYPPLAPTNMPPN